MHERHASECELRRAMSTVGMPLAWAVAWASANCLRACASPPCWNEVRLATSIKSSVPLGILLSLWSSLNPTTLCVKPCLARSLIKVRFHGTTSRSVQQDSRPGGAERSAGWPPFTRRSGL
eukprot:6495521-Alexandrium_andersonii.AAC.1